MSEAIDLDLGFQLALDAFRTRLRASMDQLAAFAADVEAGTHPLLPEPKERTE